MSTTHNIPIHTSDKEVTDFVNARLPFIINQLHVPFSIEEITQITSTSSIYSRTSVKRESFTIHTPNYIVFFSYSLKYLTVIGLVVLTKHRLPLIKQFLLNFMPTDKVTINRVDELADVVSTMSTYARDMFDYFHAHNFYSCKHYPTNLLVKEVRNTLPYMNFPASYSPYNDICYGLMALESFPSLLPEVFHACNIPFTIS